MAEHSPRPWRHNADEFDGCHNIYDADGQELCSTVGLADDEAERANTRLMASAPILLAALRQIALLGGNLPDNRLTNKGGPNDAAHRGEMYVAARKLAMIAIAETE